MLDSDRGTARIAQFIAHTTYEGIPSGAKVAAKHGILDWLGVAIGGAREPIVTILAAYAKGLAANTEASGICQGFRTAAELAALMNGAMGHALDFDDTFANSVRYNMHATTCVLPAALAMVEKRSLSGSDLLLSYLVGIETTYRKLGATQAEKVLARA